MEKKLVAYCCINLIAIACAAYFLMQHYDPEPFNDMGRTVHQSTNAVSAGKIDSRSVNALVLIMGSVALLLIGYLLWEPVRKTSREKQSDLDCSLDKKASESVSARGWAIALLVFPGCLIIPVVVAVFFGFSHFW